MKFTQARRRVLQDDPPKELWISDPKARHQLFAAHSALHQAILGTAVLQQVQELYEHWATATDWAAVLDTQFRDVVLDGKGSLLHSAAARGDTEILQYLLGKGLHVNALDDQRQTPLHRASAAGSAATLQVLLQQDGVHIMSGDSHGHTPLSRACEAGHVDCAIELLKHCDAGLPPLLRPFGTALSPPLHAAVVGHAPNDALLKLLDKPQLMRMALVNRHGQGLLHLASSTPGRGPVVAALLAAEQSPTAADADGWLPVHAAAYSGCLEALELLLRKTPECVNTPEAAPSALGSVTAGMTAGRPSAQRTPLHLALEADRSMLLVLALLAVGADLTAQTAVGETPLHIWARCSEDTHVGWLLLQRGAGMHAATTKPHSHTPLQVATQSGNMTALHVMMAYHCMTKLCRLPRQAAPAILPLPLQPESGLAFHLRLVELFSAGVPALTNDDGCDLREFISAACKDLALSASTTKAIMERLSMVADDQSTAQDHQRDPVMVVAGLPWQSEWLERRKCKKQATEQQQEQQVEQEPLTVQQLQQWHERTEHWRESRKTKHKEQQGEEQEVGEGEGQGKEHGEGHATEQEQQVQHEKSQTEKLEDRRKRRQEVQEQRPWHEQRQEDKEGVGVGEEGDQQLQQRQWHQRLQQIDEERKRRLRQRECEQQKRELQERQARSDLMSYRPWQGLSAQEKQQQQDCLGPSLHGIVSQLATEPSLAEEAVRKLGQLARQHQGHPIWQYALQLPVVLPNNLHACTAVQAILCSPIVSIVELGIPQAMSLAAQFGRSEVVKLLNDAIHSNAFAPLVMHRTDVPWEVQRMLQSVQLQVVSADQQLDSSGRMSALEAAGLHAVALFEAQLRSPASRGPSTSVQAGNVPRVTEQQGQHTSPVRADSGCQVAEQHDYKQLVAAMGIVMPNSDLTADSQVMYSMLHQAKAAMQAVVSRNHELELQLATQWWLAFVAAAGPGDSSEQRTHEFLLAALDQACREGHEAAVQALLAAGAAAPALTSHQGPHTCVCLAAGSGSVRVCKVLLSSGFPAARVAQADAESAIHVAASKGHPDVVQLLLDRNVDVNVRDMSGLTPIMRAAQAGMTATVQLLLDQPGNILTAQDGRGWTALHHAVDACMRRSCEAHMALLLVQAGAKGLADYRGSTPLHLAVQWRYAPPQLLVAVCSTCDVLAKDAADHTAIQLAAAAGNDAVLAVLQQQGAAGVPVPVSPHVVMLHTHIKQGVRRQFLQAQLFQAARRGSFNGFKEALSVAVTMGVNLNSVDDRTGLGLLHTLFAHYSHPARPDDASVREYVRAAVAAGVSVYARDAWGATALQAALRTPDADERAITRRKHMIQLLLEMEKAQPPAAAAAGSANQKPPGSSNEHAAVSRMQPAMIAQPIAVPSPWSTLMYAAARGDIEVLDSLVSRGVDVNGASEGAGVTAAMCAGRNNHLDALKRLAAAGADMQYVSPHGRTIVGEAISGDHADVVKWLLKEHKVQPHLAPSSGHTTTATTTVSTPLQLAVQLNKPQCLRVMLEWCDKLQGTATGGPDAGWAKLGSPGSSSTVGDSESSSRSGSSGKAKRAVDEPDAYRQGLLVQAILYHKKNEDLLKLLLSFKPDVNQSDHRGFTALHAAVQARDPKAVKLLLEAGANPNCRLHVLSAVEKKPKEVPARGDDSGSKVVTDQAPVKAPDPQARHILPDSGFTPLHLAALQRPRTLKHPWDKQAGPDIKGTAAASTSQHQGGKRGKQACGGFEHGEVGDGGEKIEGPEQREGRGGGEGAYDNDEEEGKGREQGRIDLKGGKAGDESRGAEGYGEVEACDSTHVTPGVNGQQTTSDMAKGGAPVGQACSQGSNHALQQADADCLHQLQQMVEHVKHHSPLNPTLAIVQLLLEYKADAGLSAWPIDSKTGEGRYTAANMVARHCKGQGLNRYDTQWLRAHGPLKHSKQDKAAARGHVTVVDWLINNFPPPEVDLSLRCASTGDTAAHFAARKGHVDILQTLILHGADMRARNKHIIEPENRAKKGFYNGPTERKDGDTPLFVAMNSQAKTWEQVARMIVESCAAVLEDVNFDGRTALHLAAERGCLSMVKFLLKYDSMKAAVNKRDVLGSTPLFMAMCSLNGTCVACLAKLETCSQETLDKPSTRGGKPALMWAAEHGETELAKHMLRAGANAHIVLDNGQTLLHHACYKGVDTLVDQLLDLHVNVEARDARTCSRPLHMAVVGGHVDIVKKLLAAKVAVDAPDSGYYTPLCHAARQGSMMIMRLLVEAGALVNHTSGSGQRPLHLAATGGHTEAVRFLIEHGAQTVVFGNDMRTPLHIAAEAGCKDILELLLSQPSTGKAAEQPGDQATHAGESCYSASTCVNLRDNKGCTALHYAAKSEDLACIDLLVKHGADVIATDHNDNKPEDYAVVRQGDNLPPEKAHQRQEVAEHLHNLRVGPVYAAREGKQHKLAEYVKKGASLEAVDDMGRTALGQAIVNGYNQLAVCLLNDYKVDLNAADRHGQTALIIAAFAGNLEMVEELRKHQAWLATPSARTGVPIMPVADLTRRTALHHAAATNGTEVLASLLTWPSEDVRVCLLAEDEAGHIPLTLAMHCDYNESVRMLIDAGFNSGSIFYQSERGNVENVLCWACRTGALDIMHHVIDGIKQGRAAQKHSDLAGKDAADAVAQRLRISNKLLNDPAAQLRHLLNEPNPEGYTPLAVAVMEDQVQALNLLLDEGADINAEMGSKGTVLHVACTKGNLDIVKKLLDPKHVVLVNRLNQQGLTPFQVACQGLPGSKDVVDLFTRLKDTTFLHAKLAKGTTLLHWAAMEGDVDTTQLLLDCKFDVFAKATSSGDHCLHVAAWEGYDHVAKLLVAAVPSNQMQQLLQATNKDTRTALHLACMRGHRKVVGVLLAQGQASGLLSAMLKQLDKEKQTPLHAAATVSQGIVEDLLAAARTAPSVSATNSPSADSLLGELVQAKDKYGLMALHLSAMGGQQQACKALLAAGSNVNAECLRRHSSTAMLPSVAAQQLQASAGKISVPFIPEPAQQNSLTRQASKRLNNKGSAPPHSSSCKEESTISSLASQDTGSTVQGKAAVTLPGSASFGTSSPNSTKGLYAERGRTPLQYAAQTAGGDSCVDVMLTHAATAVLDCKLGLARQSYLHWAAAEGCVSLMKQLIEAGLKSCLDALGDSRAGVPTASVGSHPRQASPGWDVLYADKDGNLAIHLAALNGRDGAVKCLLEFGSHASTQQWGWGWYEEQLRAGNRYLVTPLHFAVQSGDLSTVSTLLKHFQELDKKADRLMHAQRQHLLTHQGHLQQALSSSASDITVNSEQGSEGAATTASALRMVEHLHAKDKDGNTALHYAAKLHQPLSGKVVRLLRATGVMQCDIPCKHGETTLHVAASVGNTAAVEALLVPACKATSSSVSRVSPANVMATDQSGQTALHKAATGGHVDVTQVLLQHGAQPLFSDADGWLPLHLACSEGHVEVVKLLLDQPGAQPDMQLMTVTRQSPGQGRQTTTLLNRTAAAVCRLLPLQLAVKYGHAQVADTLLRYPVVKQQLAVVEESTKAGLLQMADEGGHRKVMKLLLKAGIQLDYDKPWAHRCLRQGVTDNDISFVDELLKRGMSASCTLGQEQGQRQLESHTNPLHVAIKNNYLRMAKLLVDRGTLIGPYTKEMTDILIDKVKVKDHAWIDVLLRAGMQLPDGMKLPEPPPDQRSAMAWTKEEMTEIVVAAVDNSKKLNRVLELVQENTLVLERLEPAMQQHFRDLAADIKSVANLVVNLADRPCPTTFIIVPNVPAEVTWDELRTGNGAFTKWFGFMKDLVDQPMQCIGEYVNSLTEQFGERLTLKLVCECCEVPVKCGPLPRRNGFPFLRPSESLVRMLPLMQAGMQMLRVANIASSVAKFFAPGLPSVPTEYFSKVQDLLRNIQRKANKDEFSCFQSTTDVVSEQVGPGQRELQKLLAEKDPNNEWGGLTRVVVDGQTVLFVCKECLKKAAPDMLGQAGKNVRKALEARHVTAGHASQANLNPKAHGGKKTVGLPNAIVEEETDDQGAGDSAAANATVGAADGIEVSTDAAASAAKTASQEREAAATGVDDSCGPALADKDPADQTSCEQEGGSAPELLDVPEETAMDGTEAAVKPALQKLGQLLLKVFTVRCGSAGSSNAVAPAAARTPRGIQPKAQAATAACRQQPTAQAASQHPPSEKRQSSTGVDVLPTPATAPQASQQVVAAMLAQQPPPQQHEKERSMQSSSLDNQQGGAQEPQTSQGEIQTSDQPSIGTAVKLAGSGKEQQHQGDTKLAPASSTQVTRSRYEVTDGTPTRAHPQTTPTVQTQPQTPSSNADVPDKQVLPPEHWTIPVGVPNNRVMGNRVQRRDEQSSAAYGRLSPISTKQPSGSG